MCLLLESHLEFLLELSLLTVLCLLLLLAKLPLVGWFAVILSDLIILIFLVFLIIFGWGFLLYALEGVRCIVLLLFLLDCDLLSQWNQTVDWNLELFV